MADTEREADLRSEHIDAAVKAVVRLKRSGSHFVRSIVLVIIQNHISEKQMTTPQTQELTHQSREYLSSHHSHTLM